MNVHTVAAERVGPTWYCTEDTCDTLYDTVHLIHREDTVQVRHRLYTGKTPNSLYTGKTSYRLNTGKTPYRLYTEEQQLELVHWEKPALGRTDGNVTLATKLAENFAVGTVFTKLKAVSEPEEYIITYASVPDTFSVNNTGHVTVEFSAALDYEARNSVPSTVTMTITIEVEDRNDNAPMFSNNPTTVYIAPGLGKVKAGDDTTAKFAIRMYQGVITTTGVEFERDKYTLVVTAVDGGTPPLTGSTTVIVDMGNRQKGLRPGPLETGIYP
ncbi:CELR1-like protein [Mya arenaria]|uniref:CELR1-like protein n=1 Tax=Mya arenaria TaxID=6604 RepID=A0ABY7DH68_MYAAR|nr:CELR1-like protein [Mya arenaria]